eukprot:CAMPEP_0117443756 /NCGR_PEP_ID=MMETSP0759-20121206/4869_1 /TAXON_ID=63605 /ORGANISM="Percolomonas cosmopolitus, Strain WS" /LENGTH=879 /DNA_ID=CAMNT_0005235761 /DNA_START=398 /DNA_END=3037 /DNA_ORIENTATION=-
MDTRCPYRHIFDEMAKRNSHIFCFLEGTPKFKDSPLHRYLLDDARGFHGSVESNTDELYERILDPTEILFPLPQAKVVEKKGMVRTAKRKVHLVTNTDEYQQQHQINTTPTPPDTSSLTQFMKDRDTDMFIEQSSVPDFKPAQTSSLSRTPHRPPTLRKDASSTQSTVYQVPGNPVSELNQKNQRETIKFEAGEDTSDNQLVPQFGWRNMSVTDYSDGLTHVFSVPNIYKSKREAKKVCAGKAHRWLLCHRNAEIEVKSLLLANVFDMIQVWAHSSDTTIDQDLQLHQLRLNGIAYSIGVLTLKKEDQNFWLNLVGSSGLKMEWIPLPSPHKVSMTQIRKWREWYFSVVKSVYPQLELNQSRTVPHIFVPIKNDQIDDDILMSTFAWNVAAPNTVRVGDLVKYVKDTSSGVLKVTGVKGRTTDAFPNSKYRNFAHYYLDKHQETIDPHRPIVEVETFQIPLSSGRKHLPEQYLSKLEPRHHVFEVMAYLPPILWRLHEHLLTEELLQKLHGYGVSEGNKEQLVESITFSERDSERNYERYEAWGDTVLKFLSTCSIFLAAFGSPEENLGTMERKRQELVNNDILNTISVKKGIANYCLCRYDEDNTLHEIVNGIRRATLISDKQLADIIESLVGMIYHEVDVVRAKNFLEDWRVIPPIQKRESIRESVRYRAERMQSDINSLQKLIRTVSKKFNFDLSDEAAKLYYSAVPLDWIGDAALDLLFADYVWSRGNVITPQHFTDLKQMCVSNDSFAAVMYLSEMMHLIPGTAVRPAAFMEPSIATRKLWIMASKKIGDYFEKIVGCIFLDILMQEDDLDEAVEKLKGVVHIVWEEYLDHHFAEWNKSQQTAEFEDEADSTEMTDFDEIASIASNATDDSQGE